MPSEDNDLAIADNFFAGLNGNEFLHKFYKPLQPLSEGWVNVGDNILITSKTGGGKTRMCLNYAIHSALGKDFANIKFDKPIPSYYLDGEMRPVSMQRKIQKFLPLFEQTDLSNFIYKNLTEHDVVVDFTQKEHRDHFIADLKHMGVEQVFMDNFFCLFPSIKNWNDPQEFLQFIFPFISALREAEITAWWIDHNNKAGQIFGSIAKMIHFDFIIKIYHEAEEDLFDLELIKERELLDRSKLCFQFLTDGDVEPHTSRRLGEGTYQHFWAWAEDYYVEARKHCDGEKKKMAQWLLKAYENSHEGINTDQLNADYIRKKI